MILKIKKLKDNMTFLKPVNIDSLDNDQIVETIKNHISCDESCKNIILDLTEFNFLSCARIGALVATHHFIKFISGKAYILVNDNQSKNLIETLAISNVAVIYNENQLILDDIA